MRPKPLVVASAVVLLLVAGATWWWTASDSRQRLTEAEKLAESVTDTPGPPQELAPAAENQHPRSTPLPSGARPSKPEREATGTPSAVAETLAGAAPPASAGDVREAPLTREGFTGFKELVVALSALSKGKRGLAPLDLDQVGASASEVAQLDIDGDRGVSPWEVQMAEAFTRRAEDHPIKNDLADGVYPIAREDYAKPEWEFEEIDTNRDSAMDVEEYYAFLADTERVSVELDADENRLISFEESLLSRREFAALDRDDSGDLRGWEMRRAMGLGTWDRPPPSD